MTTMHGPTILLRSGSYFDFTAPEACPITIEDIAFSLAYTCRFAGHCRHYYSVAQHCTLMSLLCEPEDAYDCLMHDAAEAVVGDIPTPLKYLLPEFRIIEARCEVALFRRFNVHMHRRSEVKKWDLIMLRTEQRDLMNCNADSWPALVGVGAHRLHIVPQPAETAARHFLLRYHELTEIRASQNAGC